MAPPIDPDLSDRVWAWYDRWPIAAKIAFWVLGGVIIVAVVSFAWGLIRGLLAPVASDRAVTEADELREQQIQERQHEIDAIEAEREQIRAERAAIDEEMKDNAEAWQKQKAALDGADGPDDVDRVYERIRERGNAGPSDG